MRRRLAIVLAMSLIILAGGGLLGMPAQAQYVPPPPTTTVTVLGTVVTTTTAPPPAVPAKKLPFTGAFILNTVRVALGVAVLGGGLLVLSRRRHRGATE